MNLVRRRSARAIAVHRRGLESVLVHAGRSGDTQSDPPVCRTAPVLHTPRLVTGLGRVLWTSGMVAAGGAGRGVWSEDRDFVLEPSVSHPFNNRPVGGSRRGARHLCDVCGGSVQPRDECARVAIDGLVRPSRHADGVVRFGRHQRDACDVSDDRTERRLLLGRCVAARRQGRGGECGRASVSANIAIRLMQLHMCVIYLFSALGKLMGETWWNGSAMWLAFREL